LTDIKPRRSRMGRAAAAGNDRRSCGNARSASPIRPRPARWGASPAC